MRRALLLLCLAGCSVEHAGDEAAPAELMGAAEDTVHTFSVGICLGAHSGGGAMGPSGTCGALTSSCSGTLIAPNLVLTARHCVNYPKVRSPLTLCTTPDNTFDGVPVTSAFHLTVTTSPSVREGRPKWYDVARSFLPEGDNPCNDDIALLLLEKNVPAAEASAIPVDVLTDLAEHTPEEIAIVGRGAILEEYAVGGDSVAAYDRGGYRRRLKSNIPVTCLAHAPGDCIATDFTFHLPPNEFALSTGQIMLGPAALGGDSGAGFLDQASFDAGAPRVVAVHSYSGVDAQGKPNSSIGIRLSPHRAFLTRVAKDAATAGGYPVPLWADDSTR